MSNWKRWLLSVKEKERDGQLVQIYGRREVIMEGCKQVLRCDEKEICIRGRFVMTVKGEGLVLKEMDEGVLCAKGLVHNVSFGE